MDRPKTFIVGGVVYWVMRLFDPDDGVTLIDADSTPTVAVRKNGSSVGDSVTVTKRSATTGIYDCSYNPASEAEGDSFILEESATISAVAYTNSWAVLAKAPERGTDGANTTAPATLTNVSDAQTAILAKLPAALVGGRMDSVTSAMANNVLTSAAIAAAALNGKGDWPVGNTGYELTTTQFNAIVAAIETEVLNDATGGAVITAIANAVAAYFDSASLDLPPQIIAAAVRNNLATELARIDAAITTRLASGSYSAPPSASTIAGQVRTELSPELTLTEQIHSRAGFLMAKAFGEISNAQSATETFVIILNGTTYEGAFTGADDQGNRDSATLTES